MPEASQPAKNTDLLGAPVEVLSPKDTQSLYQISSSLEEPCAQAGVST